MSKKYLVEFFSENGNGMVEWVKAADCVEAFNLAQEMAAKHPDVVDFMVTEYNDVEGVMDV